MPRFWRRRGERSGEGRYLSVLDLGASAVKALVIEIASDRVAILGRGRGQTDDVGLIHSVGDRLSGIAADGSIGDLDALASSCEQALCQAEDATEAVLGFKVVPDAALFAVPSACLRGAIGSGAYRRVTLETTIVTEECRTALSQAGRRALRNLGKVTGSGTWELVDATLITFSIDRHPVTDPIGFRGHLLEAAAFAVAAPRKLFTSMRQLADRLQLQPPRLVAEPLALAAASPGDGVLVEVGARTTVMCLTRYHAPLVFGVISQGGGFLTQELAQVFRLSPSRAEALKRAYSDGRLSEDGMSSVRNVLMPSLERWLSLLTGQLKIWSSAALTWSPEVYLCGGASTFPDLLQAAKEARWLALLPFPREPSIRRWDGSTMSQILDRTESRWQPEEIVALSVAAWAARNRDPETVDGVLRETLGIQ